MSDEAKEEPRGERPARMTELEIENFVHGVLAGQIFCDATFPEEQRFDVIRLAFLPAALGAFSQYTTEELDRIGCVWEWLSKASDRGVSAAGFTVPIFLSMHVMHREDYEKALELFNKKMGKTVLT